MRAVHTLGSASALIALVVGFAPAVQAAELAAPKEILYQAERVALDCNVTAGLSGAAVSISNPSGPTIPKGWVIHYKQQLETSGRPQTAKVGASLAKGQELGAALSAGNLAAGPCVAWTVLPKEPRVLVTDIMAPTPPATTTPGG